MFLRYTDILIESHESTDHLLVNKILHFLYMNTENHLSLNTLTESLKISQSYASKIFKLHTQKSIIKYSKKLKIERSKTLLIESKESVTQIGERLGFYDQVHFSRSFKSLVGMSPSNFRVDKKK